MRKWQQNGKKKDTGDDTTVRWLQTKCLFCLQSLFSTGRAGWKFSFESLNRRAGKGLTVHSLGR